MLSFDRTVDGLLPKYCGIETFTNSNFLFILGMGIGDYGRVGKKIFSSMCICYLLKYTCKSPCTCRRGNQES